MIQNFPGEAFQIVKLEACLKNVKACMTQDFLLLNSDKTDIQLIGPKSLRDKFLQISLKIDVPLFLPKRLVKTD